MSNMNRETLGLKLSQLSSQLGFTLPDGSIAHPSVFTSFLITPNRRVLFENILRNIQEKDKVQFIRKQIFLSKLNTLKQGHCKKDSMLLAAEEASSDHLQLWKEKEAKENLMKVIKTDINELQNNIYDRATEVQLLSCSLAEKETHIKENNEKKAILTGFENLCELEVKKYSILIDKYRTHFPGADSKFAAGLKKEGMKVYEDAIKQQVECTCARIEEVSCPIKDMLCDLGPSVLDSGLWEAIFKLKADCMEQLLSSAKQDTHHQIMCKKRKAVESGWQSLKLHVAEQWLETLVHKEELSRLSTRREMLLYQLYKRLLPLDDSAAPDDFSFLELSEGSDLTASALKPIRPEVQSLLTEDQAHDDCSLKKAKDEEVEGVKATMRYSGLKRRVAVLEEEVARLKTRTQREQVSRAPRDLDRMLVELDGVQKDIVSLREDQKAAQKCLEMKLEQAQRVESSIAQSMNREEHARMLEEAFAMSRDFVATQARLVMETPLDAFRRVETVMGRKVLECESLEHCLDHYRGQFRPLFAAALVSPLRSPEQILTEIIARRDFDHLLQRMIQGWSVKEEPGQGGQASAHTTLPLSETVLKDVQRTFARLGKKTEALNGEIRTVEEMIRCWNEQPYRHMIASDMTVKGQTLQEYELQYRDITKELAHANAICFNNLHKDPSSNN